jgi:hypothetical protein
MWYGGGGSMNTNPSLTVEQFLTRMGYNSKKPDNIDQNRWNAMLNWYKMRREEGLENDEINEVMG